MPQKLCIIHANCQGDCLRLLLEQSPEFNKRFTIKKYTNYKQEEIALETLKKCGLFLHQYLPPKWGALSTEKILSQINCDNICIPNMFFKGYWPFWTDGEGIIAFADSMLEELLQRKLPPEMIMRIYLKGANLFGDLEQKVQDTINHEKEKEKQSPIKYVSHIEENWRSEKLFYTVNHPGSRLLFHVADNILQILGLPRLSPTIKNNFSHPYNDFWLPIHPLVAQELKLKFIAPNQKYYCFGQELTFEQYITCYLSCRAVGETDLGAALRGLNKSAPT